MADSIDFHRPIRFSVRNANVNQYVIDTYDSVTPKTRLRFKGNNHLQFVSIVIRWKKNAKASQITNNSTVSSAALWD